ncbi:MAG: dethiobiotin synthase [Weeksellaceae bacterium]|nr:dethiobiotin synthase [Weeksellaceae bacterium]
MSSQSIFITGISTEVGKTVAAAVAVSALQADYWKPIQSGAQTDSDTATIQALCKDKHGRIHPEYIKLPEPLSPHAAAEKEGILLNLQDITRPVTQNTLIIEGAGGLLVPLNHKHLIADLLQPQDHIILVSKHYLGSINHTLLSYNYLKSKGFQKIAIWFSGQPNPSSEQAIRRHASAFYLQSIEQASRLSPEWISQQASHISESLSAFLNWNKM